MFLVSPVAHQLDGVVQSDVVLVVAPTEDPTAVQLPPAGVRGDGERADCGQVGQGSLGYSETCQQGEEEEEEEMVTWRSLGGRVL